MNRQEALQNVKKTINDYNLIADKFSSTRKNLSKDIFDLTKFISSKDTVLDYGCGNGRACQLFSPDHYLGVDPSEKLISIAKTNYPKYSFSLIQPLEIPAGKKFDVIICLSMIHHLTNIDLQKELVSGFYNTLNSNGILILTTWNLIELLKDESRIVHKPFNSQHDIIDRELYAFKKGELEDLIIDSSFKIIESKIIPRNRGKYSNIEVIARKIN